MTIDQLNTNIHTIQSDIANKNRQFLLNKKDLPEPVAKAFNNLLSFDFTEFENANTRFLQDYTLGYWLGKTNQMAEGQVLNAILFEYNDAFSDYVEALSFGIIDWKNYKLSDRLFPMGYDYKFAPGFEVVPGLGMTTFSILLPMSYENVGDDGIYYGLLNEGTGYYEMVRLVHALSMLSLNKIFRILDESDFFQPLHLKPGCLFLLCQHDDSVADPFYIKNERL
jgi:hypothetical protein